MAKLSRRQLGLLSGSLFVGAAGTAEASAQADPGAASPRSDLLAQRQAAVVRAREELQKFELAYSDEPLFRLVIR